MNIKVFFLFQKKKKQVINTTIGKTILIRGKEELNEEEPEEEEREEQEELGELDEEERKKEIMNEWKEEKEAK